MTTILLLLAKTWPKTYMWMCGNYLPVTPVCLAPKQNGAKQEGMKKRQVQINPHLFLVCFWTNNMKTPTLASLLAGAPHLYFLRHKVLRVSFSDCFTASNSWSLSAQLFGSSSQDYQQQGKLFRLIFPASEWKIYCR